LRRYHRPLGRGIDRSSHPIRYTITVINRSFSGKSGHFHICAPFFLQIHCFQLSTSPDFVANLGVLFACHLHGLFFRKAFFSQVFIPKAFTPSV
jgi:hypothetical protein